jgi:RecA-family ATPase
MATSRVEAFGPDWNNRPVVVFNGTYDTHINDGSDYDTQPLAALFTLEPTNVPKFEGPAFIPSSYCSYDAREHAVQRVHGSYGALTCDIDKGNHPLHRVEQLVQQFCQDAAYLIYSSPHSRPGDARWRGIIPLASPVPFEDWYDAQIAMFAFMEHSGVEVDHALSRAAQPVFLPNVPVKHQKTGEALRGAQGAPLYFARAKTALTAPGLSLSDGAVWAGITQIRSKRAQDDAERERLRREAERRRQQQSSKGGDKHDIIASFNSSNTIADMLMMYGYQQSPRHPEGWRSTYQQGETFATRIMGDKWVSLSSSDAAAGIGATCSSGCYGDAYDLFLHFEHKGDHKAAFRQLHRERRDAQVTMPGERPEYEARPDWDYDPETGEPIGEFVDYPDEEHQPGRGQSDQADAPRAGATALLPLVNPADWTGHEPPVREWRWDSFMPDGQATLLTGAGAAGKSLATQQMATCIAMGLPFLGVPTKQAPALYITCEDDLDELHRRQDAICASLGITLESTRGRLFLLSLQGEIGNELAHFDHEGGMTIAPRYTQIEQTCIALGIKHCTIDNTAHSFAGNENARNEVAAFVNLNNRLAQAIGGSVLMVGHPNKAGDSYSGSTAWENQVRSRLYLEVPRNDDGVPIDPDRRLLRNEKANYSQRGSEVHFYWFKGAFVLPDDMPLGGDNDVRDSAQAGYENGLFLTLLDRLTDQKRHVSHSRNLGNYAPKVMAAMPEAKGLQAKSFAQAMERLFTLDQIAASVPLWKGRDRHPVHGLARKNQLREV